jgi:hypothetical protein
MGGIPAGRFAGAPAARRAPDAGSLLSNTFDLALTGPPEPTLRAGPNGAARDASR